MMTVMTKIRRKKVGKEDFHRLKGVILDLMKRIDLHQIQPMKVKVRNKELREISNKHQ